MRKLHHEIGQSGSITDGTTHNRNNHHQQNRSDHLPSSVSSVNLMTTTTTTTAWHATASLHQSGLSNIRSEYASPFMIRTSGQRIVDTPFIAKVF